MEWVERVPTNWGARYRQNVELVKSGGVEGVVTVVERLEERDRTKGLSAGEQRMLARAQSILESEAMLGLPDGWEGDEPDEGGEGGVREPRPPTLGGPSGHEGVTIPML